MYLLLTCLNELIKMVLQIMDRKKFFGLMMKLNLLRSHIIFLSEKGYEVDTVTNGEDAITSVKEKAYDLIFLDEMMAGMGGLETLAQIKNINTCTFRLL
ncbi:MAG: response regulator [Ignavibacteriales bacterium]|nr:response regulator [Ignavibacteriales bacterium]